ncbi:response regulator [Caldimonas brevitalea]|uniref:Two-component response regulator n=1 Tax=Caldimonas brevitalea TaxID=413882 RepID=A0A0G3BVI4_9BURK|nr:response regulator [Caldimonas brevitalea]AKJ32038.1 two-component response regulator [Caldimonas brevitalea]
MSIRYRVAVQGFSSFERATFEAFFRLAARRSPAYDYVAELTGCDYVVADADAPETQPAVVAAGKWERALFVGAAQVNAALAQLPRPINLMQLLRALDDIVRRDTPESPPPETPAHDPLSAPLFGHSLRRVPALGRPSDFQSSSNFSNAVLVEGDEKFEHILVVDDNDLALRFIQSRLKRFGFKVHLARSGDEAMQRLDEQPFDFVFLDVMTDDMDGYHICRNIKRRRPANGQQVPVVVLLGSRANAIDKIRGALAGCDAYLAKPLVEDELVRVIGSHHEVFQRAFDSTMASIAATRPTPDA